MDQGRQNNKDQQRKPSWTERSVPEPVRPGQTRPLNPDEEALVPAADPIVQAAYKRTGTSQIRPLMDREGQTDALVIQKTAKQVRVINYDVVGVHWRAGFAPEVGQTPLSQYVPANVPPDKEMQAGNGFILRPVETHLEDVLRELIPANFLQLEEEMFGRLRELGGVYMYFIPQPKGALVGIVCWYLTGPAAKTHLLYLQTEVQKADARILDEMHKSFKASHAARTSHGPAPRPLDFWQEIQLATTQVEATIKNSSFSKNSAEVKDKVRAARFQAESTMHRSLDSGLARLASGLRFTFIQLPQILLAGLVRAGAAGIIAAVKGLDRAVAKKDPDGL